MLLSVSRSLERIDDHASNISEDIIYMLEGKLVRHIIDNRDDEQLHVSKCKQSEQENSPHC